MARVKSDDFHNFKFKNISNCQYAVTYKTDRRGDYWIAIMNSNNGILGQIIEAERDFSKKASSSMLTHLRWCVIHNGEHYNANDEKIN